MARELEPLPNKRIKLTACGMLTNGKKRRRSHAAAYPRRYTDKAVK
jgi:hypothetical protein